jgi:photosystem II stability/assembly factor-like uncharacterized protein
MQIQYIFIIICAILAFNSKAQFNPQQKKNTSLTFSDLQLQFNEWKNTHDLSKEKGWKYYKRWEHEMLLHTMPNGKPASSELYLTEILKASAEKQYSNKNSSQGLWTSFGPDSLPPSPNPYQQHGMGRINCMAFHPNDPNTYWIGVAQGGIWKTNDNGASWTSLSDQLPILRISDIAIDPNNTDVIYVSLCDFEYIDISLSLDGRKRNTHYGLGVYKTTDGGINWQATGLSFTIDNLDASLIRKILINPNNSNELVAAGVSGMYTSTDAGNNWTQVLDSLFWDLVQDPSNPDILYAATGYLENSDDGYASIMKSTDFGQSWTELNSGIPSTGVVQRIKLAIAESDPNYVYAICTDLDKGMYGIYKSTDTGNNWNLQYNSLNLLEWSEGYSSGGQGTYDLVFMVSPTDKNTVYAGGINLWGSTDGANSFNPISYWVGYYGPSLHADQHFLTYQSLTGNYFICNDGGIYRSPNLIAQSWSSAYVNDWPTVWANISHGMAITSFYRLSSSKKNDGRIIAGAQDNSTFYFDGSSWLNVIGGDGMDNWIDANDPYTFIGSSQYGNFEMSTDGGYNTNGMYISNEQGEWTTPIIEEYSTGTLYVGYGNVFKTSNKGNSWKKISNFPVDANSGFFPEISAIAASSSVSNVLYVTKRVRYEYDIKGACYMTNNGGTSWNDITSGLPDSLYFTSVEISSDDPNTAWVSCAGLSDGNKIFKTTDAGQNWQNISYDLPNLPVNTIKQIPGSNTHQLLIGNDIGVYYIDDSTYGWTSYNNGLPNVIVSDIEINAEADKIYISTFGRGIWESSLSDVIISKVTDENNPLRFDIYPSLLISAQNFSIEFNNNERGKLLINIFDISGRLIQQHEFAKKADNFNTKLNSPVISGLYWLEISLGNKSAKRQIIVKK